MAGTRLSCDAQTHVRHQRSPFPGSWQVVFVIVTISKRSRDTDCMSCSHHGVEITMLGTPSFPFHSKGSLPLSSCSQGAHLHIAHLMHIRSLTWREVALAMSYHTLSLKQKRGPGLLYS